MSHFSPEEPLVDAVALQEVAELSEARVRPVLEGLGFQMYLAEEFEQLSRAALGVPRAIEARENAPYLVERNSVASMVGAGLAERHSAAREHLANDFGDVADRVVLVRGSDVQDLAVHPFARARSIARTIASVMSSACTSGRHGVPSFVRRIPPVVHASPARLFSTTSNRIRGEAPKAVALRRKVGEKSSSASAPTSSSTQVLEIALAVFGRRGDSSSTVSLATPYTLHDGV